MFNGGADVAEEASLLDSRLELESRGRGLTHPGLLAVPELLSIPCHGEHE